MKLYKLNRADWLTPEVLEWAPEDCITAFGSLWILVRLHPIEASACPVAICEV
jgi:hypothetical protein